MQLDDRKKRILAAIIENYIRTAEPVGSRTISKLDGLGVSSATIRNEMADLEEMGLLEQPHTSSGRIPSNLGYRTYVDRLMKRYELSAREISRLHSLMEIEIAEADALVKEITNIYSHITNYAVIGVSPKRSQGYIKNFHMVPIDEYSVLLIVVTSDNKVKNKKIVFDKPVDSAMAMRLSEILNSRLAGVTNNEINLNIITRLQDELSGYDDILIPVLKFVSECLDSLGDNEVFLSGVSNLLNFPEYRDVQRAKQLMDFLENKNNLHDFVTIGDNVDAKIIIGSENSAIELKDCSIVLSSYKVNGEDVGMIGLIGPTRMDYSRALSNLEFLTKHLDKLLPGNDTEGRK